MVSDISAGTQASLAFKNEAGLEDAIIPLNGEFHDEKHVLTFASGKFRVLMDSDSCNSALKGAADTVDVSNEQDSDEQEKVGDEDEGDGNLFKRKLRNPTVAKTSRSITTSSSKSRVLTRHREEYMKARLAIQEGRHLTESLFVEVEVEGKISLFILYCSLIGVI